MAEQRVKTNADFNTLPPGAYRFEVKVKDPVLQQVCKLVADGWRIALIGDIWDAAVIKAIELRYPKIKMPRTNLVNYETGLDSPVGKFRARKGWDEKTKEFWFWLAVIK